MDWFPTPMGGVLCRMERRSWNVAAADVEPAVVEPPDRLDYGHFAMSVDAGDNHFCGWSSSPVRRAGADFKIHTVRQLRVEAGFNGMFR